MTTHSMHTCVFLEITVYNPYTTCLSGVSWKHKHDDGVGEGGLLRESQGNASASKESNSTKEQASKSPLGTRDFALEYEETHKPTRQCQRAFKERLTGTGLGGVEE